MHPLLWIAFGAGAAVILLLITIRILRKVTGVEDLPDASREYWDDDKSLLN